MATWADTGKVHVWDLNAPLHALAGPTTPASTHQCAPIFTNSNHRDEVRHDASVCGGGVRACGAGRVGSGRCGATRRTCAYAR